MQISMNVSVGIDAMPMPLVPIALEAILAHVTLVMQGMDSTAMVRRIVHGNRSS
jgi:hypothetical protein